MFCKYNQLKTENFKTRIYQHCMLVNEAPHILPCESEFKKKFKKSKALFGQYIYDYDCGNETSWWYCIKDDIYDINLLNSKTRYEINKGRKFFDIKIFDPLNYVNEIYEIDSKKFQEYPASYRTKLSDDKLEYVKSKLNENNIFFGLFDKDSNMLNGYSIITDVGNGGILLNVVSIDPLTYKRNSSCAIIDGILKYFMDSKHLIYISDGARNIKHITNYQKFLCKNFEFRLVYCKMKMVYKWYIKITLAILKPFKSIFINSKNKLLYNIGSLLKLDEYSKQSQKE